MTSQQEQDTPQEHHRDNHSRGQHPQGGHRLLKGSLHRQQDRQLGPRHLRGSSSRLKLPGQQPGLKGSLQGHQLRDPRPGPRLDPRHPRGNSSQLKLLGQQPDPKEAVDQDKGAQVAMHLPGFHPEPLQPPQQGDLLKEGLPIADPIPQTRHATMLILFPTGGLRRGPHLTVDLIPGIQHV